MTVRTDPIADLRSPTGSLITLYADRPSPGGFTALLTDLLRPLRERSEKLARPVRMSVRVDVDRIRDLAQRLEGESAPSYAIFASSADGVFVLEPLAHPTPNISILGPRPYLRPLRAAPRALRSGVLVADRAKARTFVGFEGVVEESGTQEATDTGKSNYGGFAGYAEHGVRARAEESSARLWREAGARLLEIHQERPLDYVAIGCLDEHLEEIARSLHPYLARLPRASFLASPHQVSLPLLRSEIVTLDQEIRRSRQEAIAGRVCDTAWSGGNAVLGLAATIDASNAQAVDTLVVAGSFSRPGVICNNCGHLARSGETCPVCGESMFEVDDVVAALMDSVVDAGGNVFQIGVPSPLDVDGVGALTRFSLVN